MLIHICRPKILRHDGDGTNVGRDGHKQIAGGYGSPFSLGTKWRLYALGVGKVQVNTVSREIADSKED